MIKVVFNFLFIEVFYMYFTIMNIAKNRLQNYLHFKQVNKNLI